MARVRSKDTGIERAVRSALHRRGLRFRKHVRKLPGSPDIVFARARVAVFVDGRFWHGYDFPSWKHKLSPYWREKIERNIARDERNFQSLRDAGWCVLRVWEHEVMKELPAVLDRIERAVRSRRPGPVEPASGD
jgi:DNA mismatch endonuclease (patch repair protein)